MIKYFWILILFTCLSPNSIQAQTDKGCSFSILYTTHGGCWGYCPGSYNTTDTVYFNGLLDSVRFNYGNSGASCLYVQSAQIYYNGNPVPTPQLSGMMWSYKAAQAGTWRVTWYDGQVNDDFTVELISTAPASVSTVEEITPINIYPNPASNFITIETDQPQEQTARLYNLMGKTVKTVTLTKTVRLAISDLPAGIYYLQLGNSTRKVVKK